jgi:hypothetical protein
MTPGHRPTAPFGPFCHSQYHLAGARGPQSFLEGPLKNEERLAWAFVFVGGRGPLSKAGRDSLWINKGRHYILALVIGPDFEGPQLEFAGPAGGSIPQFRHREPPV